MRVPESIDGVLGIFGGMFDPVHHGHLRTAYELRARLGIDRVHFVPAAEPPHRAAPEAPVELRLAMLEAALEHDPGSVIDRRELEREGPSYSIDTALDLRREFPDHALCLLLGMDAFLGLTGWRDWQRLLDIVNIVVARRPGASLPDQGPLGRLLAQRRVVPDAQLAWAVSGQIVVQDVTQLEISSSDLRASIRSGIEPRYLMPDSVWQLIQASGCYAG
ncbi:MAG TPA: nicotinate-nucleotide adenylyltransferase [Gammaproteobacteria bacterium]|nr:nicotinate-nucleotide adenylyltransferase [Gammaproteobacteria bacterium]